MSDEQTKDTMVTFRSTIAGKNSKGGDRTQLYLTQEQAQTLIDELSAHITNDLGVKIDLHVSERTAKETGRKFKSAIAFVKAVQPQSGGFGGAQASAPKKFQAKKPATLGAKAS